MCGHVCLWLSNFMCFRNTSRLPQSYNIKPIGNLPGAVELVAGLTRKKQNKTKQLEPTMMQ